MGIADETDRTLFVGNLDQKVTEELLFELFLQVTIEELASATVALASVSYLSS